MKIEDTIKALAATTVFLLTSGTLLHDTKLDEAFALSLPVAAGLASSQIMSSPVRSDQGSSPHTHIERSSLSRNSAEGTPRIQPRDDKKHYLPKYLSRNNAHFGTSGVIWPNE